MYVVPLLKFVFDSISLTLLFVILKCFCLLDSDSSSSCLSASLQGTPGAPGAPGNTGPPGKQGQLGPPVSPSVSESDTRDDFPPHSGFTPVTGEACFYVLPVTFLTKAAAQTWKRRKSCRSELTEAVRQTQSLSRESILKQKHSLHNTNTCQLNKVIPFSLYDHILLDEWLDFILARGVFTSARIWKIIEFFMHSDLLFKDSE